MHLPIRARLSRMAALFVDNSGFSCFAERNTPLKSLSLPLYTSWMLAGVIRL